MKIFTKFLTILLFGFFIVSSFEIIINSANAVTINNPTCAAGDGCKSSCDPAADPACVPDCTTPDPDCNPATCFIDGSGGLIPCGKNCDDPLTPYWDEREPCSLCHGILMSQLIIEFLVKIAGIAAIIAIAIGGFLYMFAVGNSGTIDKAKSIIKYVLIGFLVVFMAWAIIATILTTFGYIDPIDGIGPDKWHAVNC